MSDAPSRPGRDEQPTAVGAPTTAVDGLKVIAARARIPDAERAVDPGAGERLSRLGSALVAMAQDLAASNRENRALRAENRHLRREIEQLERRCSE